MMVCLCREIVHNLLEAARGKSEIVSKFVKYPGSSTNATVAGKLYVLPVGNQHKISWKLTGTDDACPMGSGNVCGIHIHKGRDCSDASTIEGHLFSNSLSDDPWTAVRYNSTNGMATSETGELVVMGLPTSDLVGRAVIVHNSVGAGERIACGVLEVVAPKPSLSVSSWVRYPGSSTSLAVSGTVTIRQLPAVEPTISVTWSLGGTDDKCLISNASGNVCGIHVHEGTSCDTHDGIGGHYYNKLHLDSDPWTAVRYSSTGGKSKLADGVQVPTGLARSSLVGHTVVVHSSEGAGERIACGTLSEVAGPAAQVSWASRTCMSGLLLAMMFSLSV